MLQHSFLHIPGIGPKTERRLWASGASDWAAGVDAAVATLPPKRREPVSQALDVSRRRLAEGDAHYFARRLPAGQHWRLFDAFRGHAAYLDIETTGLGADCSISTIAVFDGRRTATYVNGRNLNDFADDIRRFRLLVTYNGKCFDVPVIERVLGCRLAQAHIDLRYVLAALGVRGGLKRCEAQLGMGRGDLAEVDGLFAVVLWNAYRRTGDESALETLLAYNLEDAINLERLMVHAYNLNIDGTPFSDHRLPVPDIPPNPFRIHRTTLARYRREVDFIRSLQPGS